jgi:hypothetical protein
MILIEKHVYAHVCVTARYYVGVHTTYECLYAVLDGCQCVLMHTACCTRQQEDSINILHSNAMGRFTSACAHILQMHMLTLLFDIAACCLMLCHVKLQYWASSTTARCNVIRSASCISYTAVLLQCCYCYILSWARYALSQLLELLRTEHLR